MSHVKTAIKCDKALCGEWLYSAPYGDSWFTINPGPSRSSVNIVPGIATEYPEYRHACCWEHAGLIAQELWREK